MVVWSWGRSAGGYRRPPASIVIEHRVVTPGLAGGAAQVAAAVGSAAPDVIVHELTAIGALNMRHFDRDFAPTNRLRTEGTDHLLSAAQAVGVRRFVARG